MGSEPALFFLLLLISTLGLYIFPFLPAILEWKWKTDALPPRISFLDKTIVDYEIRLFREYIEMNFASLIKEHGNSNTVYEGKNSNDKEYVLSTQQGWLQLTNKELTDKKSIRDIIFCQNGGLPGGVRFMNRIYATDSIDIGSMAIINELFAEKNITLNTGVTVNTLLCSGDTITVQHNCILNKYTRAKNRIHFISQADFQYLSAPLIEFGNVVVKLPNTAIDVISGDIVREVVKGKLDIPANSNISRHFVAKGRMVIHSGCKINGNIKCHQDLHIEKNTTILGAIICNRDIIIEDDCVIQGPIVSTATIRIGRHCTIGTRDAITSLIAEHLVISNGCLISGLVLAKVKGSYQG